MMDYEDYIRLIRGAFIRRGLIKTYDEDVLMVKCPDYISSLPYGNAKTLDEIYQRISAINTKIDEEFDKIEEHEKNIKDQKDLIKDLEKDNKDQEKDKKNFQKDIDDFKKLDEKIRKEKLKEAKELGVEFDNLRDNIQDITDGFGLSRSDEKVFDGMSSVQGYFYSDTSILSDKEVKEINKLADDFDKVLDNAPLGFGVDEYDLADRVRNLAIVPTDLNKAEEKSRVATAIIIESDNIIESNNDEIKKSQDSIKKSETEIDKSNTRIRNLNDAYDKAQKKRDKIKENNE